MSTHYQNGGVALPAHSGDGAVLWRRILYRRGKGRTEQVWRARVGREREELVAGEVRNRAGVIGQGWIAPVVLPGGAPGKGS